MNRLRDESDFDDDQLKFLKKERFYRRYPSLQDQATARLASTQVLTDDGLFVEWLDHLPKEEKQSFLQARRDKLPGTAHYDLPLIRLTRDVPLAAVAKVFETLNRTGLKLGTFDLMVAKLYPSAFKLRDQWQGVEARTPEFKQFGIDGIDVLRLIALREHLRQHYSEVRPQTVKGLREADVLQLQPETVIAEWDKAVEGLQRTLDFIRDRCGCVRGALVPSKTMLLPLADALMGDGGGREDYRRRLVSWFWATSFVQSYSQGANTQAVADAKALRAWAVDTSAVPRAVTEFNTEFDASTLSDSRRRNEILVLGLACLIISTDGRDWKQNVRLKDVTEDIEIHHIFADHYVESRQWGAPPADEDPHRVANLTPIAASTNASLRNDAPAAVLANRDVHRSALEGHRVSLDAFGAEDYPRFHAARREALMQLMREAVLSGLNG